MQKCFKLFQIVVNYDDICLLVNRCANTDDNQRNMAKLFFFSFIFTLDSVHNMVHFHHKDLYNYLIILFKLQEVLRWIQGVVKEIGADVSTEKLKEFVWKTLKSGKVRRNNS